MDPFDPDAIIHVLSRCESCQLGQVGTRVCVEKGHLATVASVKRSERGANFVDPYTEEEVDARYRLMLKPGEAEVICGVRKADNTFERMTYTFGPEDMGWEKEGDAICLKDTKETIGNIKSFSLEGSSGDPYFDKRVRLSNAGLEVGMEWIMARL